MKMEDSPKICVLITCPQATVKAWGLATHILLTAELTITLDDQVSESRFEAHPVLHVNLNPGVVVRKSDMSAMLAHLVTFSHYHCTTNQPLV